MITISRIIAALMLALTIGHGQSPVSISNLHASQRAGTKLVDISYDIEGGTGHYMVTFEALNNGESTAYYPQNSVENFTGHAETVILSGEDRLVEWDIEADRKYLDRYEWISWLNDPSPSVSLRLVAREVYPGSEGFALVPSGEFDMGVHVHYEPWWYVEVPNPFQITLHLDAFLIGIHEVTKSEWDLVQEWGVANGYSDLPLGVAKSEGHPVHSLTWFEVLKWCNAKSEMEGFTPCYSLGGETFRTGESMDVHWAREANGYRLPSEAEWEKAARGGVPHRRYPWGYTIHHGHANFRSANLGDQVFYDRGPTDGYHPDYASEGFPYTAPVGSFLPNGYGLYDVIGNVAEWCWETMAYRGGSWSQTGYEARIYQGDRFSEQATNSIGFRVVRSVPDSDDRATWQPQVVEVLTNTFAVDARETLIGEDDADGDGIPNAQEWQAGTDPLDSNSYLHVKSINWLSVGGELEITWTSVIGTRYHLEHCYDLEDWRRVADVQNATPPLNTLTIIPDLQPDVTSFYRLVVSTD